MLDGNASPGPARTANAGLALSGQEPGYYLASELLNALGAVSHAADGWDDELSKELGGKTYEAVEMETSGGAIET